MTSFNGFPDGRSRPVPVPVEFFTHLLPTIEDPLELRVILHAFWSLEKQEGSLRYFLIQDFVDDPVLMKSLDIDIEKAKNKLNKTLENITRRGIFLHAVAGNDDDDFYVLNSPSGKAAITAYKKGAWSPSQTQKNVVKLAKQTPNIYKLYEENIGVLTPLIAEDLKAAEQLYPQQWVEEAFREAVQRNARSWKYIETILRRWKEQGRDGADQTTDKKDRRKYIEGEYGDIIKH